MAATSAILRPSPHGEGGLKSLLRAQPMAEAAVPPRMGRVD